MRPFVKYVMLLIIGVILGIYLEQSVSIWPAKDTPGDEQVVKFDDTRKTDWPADFKIVEIKSGVDSNIQKAYFYKSGSEGPGPLIVSLHTWSGDYSQKDPLARLCLSKDLNYIHPDFRGPDNTQDACCSDLVLSDIDEAIMYAKENANVDPGKVYVIGVSGGGYATLCTFMRSKHNIKKFSAWAAIANLEDWYYESKIRENKYAGNILNCTGSNDSLNTSIARQRSPAFWQTPTEKFAASELEIYAGVYDGIRGSVPITHSINFYNKILTELNVTDPSLYVSANEKLTLLEDRKPLGNFGSISNRKIYLSKQFKNIKLVIFDGDHEMLPEYALNRLLN